MKKIVEFIKLSYGSTQVILIAFKMFKITNVNWLVILIPTWIYLSLIVLGVLLLTIAEKREYPKVSSDPATQFLYDYQKDMMDMFKLDCSKSDIKNNPDARNMNRKLKRMSRDINRTQKLLYNLFCK